MITADTPACPDVIMPIAGQGPAWPACPDVIMPIVIGRARR